ncbi:6-bladed beta-propeller [Niabella insulamsoli]|uniref:6-bladed beta-propeller n=1 Tax=Niabella insulamsoli TaxID=3144874 RepID=UPI0031FCA03F
MRKWLTIFCFLWYCGASGQGTPKDLYFQPGFASGSSVSKVFEEVVYIPLETTKKSLFGRIRTLIVSDKYFIIWDADTNFIYFFDKTGKFVKKYRPPNCTIKSIQLDRNRNALFISGSNKNFSFSPAEIEKMMEDPTNKSFARFTWSAYYDLSDIQKEKIQRVKDFSLSLISPTIFTKNLWAYSYIYANRKFEDRTAYELNIYDGEKTIKSYFPYNKQTDSFHYKPDQISFFPITDRSKLLFTRPFDYTFYELTTDSVKALYKLIMPMEISLPKSFFSFSFRSQNDIDQYRHQNGSLVWELDNVCKAKDYLFFTLDYYKSWREKNFMYDESTGRFYNTSKISADSTNGFLPVLPGSIQYNTDDYLYTSISSSSMFQNKEYNQRRNPQYSPALKRYFEKGNRADNPVIVQLKLKNKIG